jgi:hypothetical protein
LKRLVSTKLRQNTFAGDKLFPRELLEKISLAIERGDSSIKLPDYVDGMKRPYQLDLDLGYHDYGQ